MFLVLRPLDLDRDLPSWFAGFKAFGLGWYLHHQLSLASNLHLEDHWTRQPTYSTEANPSLSFSIYLKNNQQKTVV